MENRLKLNIRLFFEAINLFQKADLNKKKNESIYKNELKK